MHNAQPNFQYFLLCHNDDLYFELLDCLSHSGTSGSHGCAQALGMRRIGGMDIQIIGKAHIPAEGPVIIAAKHQSYGDGFAREITFRNIGA